MSGATTPRPVHAVMVCIYCIEWWPRGGTLKSDCAATLMRDYHCRYVTARKSAVIKHTAPESSRGMGVALSSRSIRTVRRRCQRGTELAVYRQFRVPTNTQQITAQAHTAVLQCGDGCAAEHTRTVLHRFCRQTNCKIRAGRKI
jgi:hypothetical protein